MLIFSGLIRNNYRKYFLSDLTKACLLGNIMKNTEIFISDKETLERLVRLETKAQLKFEELEKALVLAREQIERDTTKEKERITEKFEHANNFQQRMERLESTFFTQKEHMTFQENYDIKLDGIKRILYIGVGIVIALEFVLQYIWIK